MNDKDLLTLENMPLTFSCDGCVYRALENCIHCAKVRRVTLDVEGEKQIVWDM